ncbi:MAG: hypothetical protein CTY25_08830 [Methylobacterium sp.]|nr:MAG: hypothetical protein CTY25_08830 [Methylobacterium sp.]
MLFNIEHDTGDRITGYLVPDNFSSIARVRLMNRGELISVFETPEERAALVAGARHETGRCGFTIDDRDIPNLAMQFDVELYDDDTGCLLYRRMKPTMIAKKVIRFETQLLPFWRFDERLFQYFQYIGKGVDRYGRETVTQMMLLENIHSLYMSGRINYKNYAYFIDNGFQCFCMLQDPHDDCAERLLVLRNVAKVGPTFLGERDAKRFAPAIQFAETLPLSDEKSLRRALQDMPDEVAGLLANPLTRLLTTTNPDDMPGTSAIASALDVLSSFAVVGLRNRPEEFNLTIGEWLGIADETLPALPPFQSVSPLGEFLKSTKVLDVILEKDMELYQTISEALRPLDDVVVTSPLMIDGSSTSVVS